MWLPCLDIDTPLHFRATRTIEDKDRNDGQGQEPTKTVDEDTKCRVIASLGASSGRDVNCHLSLIHPDTEEMSEENIIINLIHLVSMPMNRHRSGRRFFSNPSVTDICVRLLISDAGDTACMEIYLEDQKRLWIQAYRPQVTNAHLKDTGLKQGWKSYIWVNVESASA